VGPFWAISYTMGPMKTFSHIALLGRQPELGLVELESLLGAAALEPYGRQAALLDQAVDINNLGGAVKVGRILYDGPAASLRPMPIALEALPVSEGKTPFAISTYGLKATTAFVVAAGIELKKSLKQRGSMRFVAPSEKTAVSVAQLKFNKILERGFELLVVVVGQRMVIAQTTGVQDIDWYSKRDYDRPARSAKVGMLPPKLAQILVNTTHAPMVVDPFCGTGVVLQEALLRGRAAAGSDLSPEMVAATRTNLTWLADQVSQELLPWQVELADAREVRLPDMGLAVVSEGYLGPNLSATPGPDSLAKIQADLRALYQETLRNLAPQLASGAELALCVPAHRTPKGWQYLGLVDDLARLGYTIKVFKHVPGALLYARPDQVVGRQLLLLRKK